MENIPSSPGFDQVLPTSTEQLQHPAGPEHRHHGDRESDKEAQVATVCQPRA